MKKIFFVLSIVLFSTYINAQSFKNDTLATHPYWLKLGHYRGATLGDWKSEVDSAEFFYLLQVKQVHLTNLKPL
ncbi:hypothetical protein P20652_0046 [Pseudoalteromonas sp. BSi20652]|nr:hypothetical protein P20652_0046 [Pseudoalteromonas sp. BSi20652]